MIRCPQPACEREFSRPGWLARHLRESHGVYRNEHEPADETDTEPELVEVEAVDEVDVSMREMHELSFEFNDSEMQTLEALAFLNRTTPHDEANRLLTEVLDDLAADADVVALLVAREEVGA